MLCDFLTLDQIKALTGTPSVTDEALMILYDTTLDYVFNSLGQSFGLGLRVWHDGTGSPSSWNVRVVSDRVTLFTYSPNSQYDIMFADEPTIGELAVAIESLDGGVSDVLDGWEAQVVFPEYADLPSSFLTEATVGAGATGYEYRKLLCLSTYRETLNGNLQSRLPLSMYAALMIEVCEDGTVLTQGTDYYLDAETRAVLIRYYSDGSQYCKYTTDYWSVASPNNVRATYVPVHWRAKPYAKMYGAIRGLMFLALTTTGYKSETIGDYSYMQDGASAAMWLEALADYVVPVPALSFWLDP